VSDTIVVVEDELSLRRLLRSTLGSHGFGVRETATIDEAEREIAKSAPAAILLDLGLPDGDGLDLLRRIRTWSSVPVIVLSARGRERDKVDALDAGADDYVTKPFAANELLARIRAAIRRARSRAAALADQPVLEIGPFRIDRARHEVAVDGRPVHLTPIEFRLLVILARSPGRVITHDQLMAEVWGSEAVSNAHQLRVHVAALRRKLEVDPARPRWLQTELGVGYRICDGDDS
jgi:two-component system KDP operon response regulator KdpE